MDIHAYRAKQFRQTMNNENVLTDIQMVYSLFQRKNEYLKKEERVNHLMHKYDLDYDAAAGIAGKALSQLVAEKKIDRLERGMYSLHA